MNVAAILLLLVAASATRTNGAGIVELASAGSKFEDLPYAAWLSAGNNQINVSIEVGYVILYRGGGTRIRPSGLAERVERKSLSLRFPSAATNPPRSPRSPICFPRCSTLIARNDDGSVLMRVDAPVYRNLDDDSETLAPFGPLLRLQRGGWYTANVVNNLEPQPGGNRTTSAEAGITNFHVHGLHVGGGVPSIDTATTYLGGDNIFIEIGEGESNFYRATVPNDHLPGIHWWVLTSTVS